MQDGVAQVPRRTTVVRAAGGLPGIQARCYGSLCRVLASGLALVGTYVALPSRRLLRSEQESTLSASEQLWSRADKERDYAH